MPPLHSQTLLRVICLTRWEEYLCRLRQVSKIIPYIQCLWASRSGSGCSRSSMTLFTRHAGEARSGPTLPIIRWWGASSARAPSRPPRYLRHHGQDRSRHRQTPRPRTYLMAPLPGDYGAHGPFDHVANGQSTQFWVRTHRAQLGMAIGALALAWVLLARRAR